MKKLLLISLLVLFGCDEDNPAASDITAPIVTITYPVDGSTLSVQTTISASVVDASDITSVVFLVNGSEAFIDTEAPYEYSWDVCALNTYSNPLDYINGITVPSTVLVNATDSEGNVGVSSLLTYSVGGGYDCIGDCGGDAVVDECGVCDDDSTNNCGQDCAGNWGGDLVYDECGVCGGDNSTCTDCSGIINGLDFDCGGGCGENIEIWGECYNIETTTYLNIGDTNIWNYYEDVPPEIGSLVNLTSLVLSYNHLTSIPSEIGNLTNLTSLDLRYNPLTSLPSEIGNLTNLTSLNLSHNSLTSLPSEIGNLTNLTSLDLSYNSLTSLPETICDLSSNIEFAIGGNNLCQEFQYECITNEEDEQFWGNQNESNCDCNGITGGDAVVDECGVCEGDGGSCDFNSNHLIFTQICITPTEAEYIAIFNPTSQLINLSDYYITDASKSNEGKFYYKINTQNDYWSGQYNDFIARFPEEYYIESNETIILSLHNNEIFSNFYGYDADLTLFEDMRNAFDGVTTISLSNAFVNQDILNDDAEMLMIFKWDGFSDIVQDVDYFIWGNTDEGINKTGVNSYYDDTPLNNQSYQTPHNENQKFVRIFDEGNEVENQGNGITGHDETSEDLINTWFIRNFND